MDLASTWEHLAAQGTMFWSASGAVALGLTLILTAGIAQIRRNRRRGYVEKGLGAAEIRMKFHEGFFAGFKPLIVVVPGCLTGCTAVPGGQVAHISNDRDSIRYP